ncbi:MAG: PTS sugar transporter subunit IIB [Candidatus Adiutrix sp.]|nr:PTS sugar transporter subunit IIB [Candidatus Adiutrix sp.]
MTLVWSRVDSKLIHGQIAAAWVPHLGAEVIVVADGDTAGDPQAQRIMRLGLPPEISQAHFRPLPGLAGFLAGPELAEKRVLLIFKSLAGALEAAEAGLDLKELNLGNQLDRLSREEGQRLAETFFARREELALLAQLSRRGLKVVIQSVPTAKSVKWRPQGGR